MSGECIDCGEPATYKHPEWPADWCCANCFISVQEEFIRVACDELKEVCEATGKESEFKQLWEE